MNPNLDLTKLVLTHHAKRVMAERDVTPEAVVDCLRNFQVCEPHQGSRRYTKGDLCVVVAEDAPVVITVLWRKRSQWTSAQMRSR